MARVVSWAVLPDLVEQPPPPPPTPLRHLNFENVAISFPLHLLNSACPHLPRQSHERSYGFDLCEIQCQPEKNLRLVPNLAHLV